MLRIGCCLVGHPFPVCEGSIDKSQFGPENTCLQESLRLALAIYLSNRNCVDLVKCRTSTSCHRPSRGRKRPTRRVLGVRNPRV